MIVFLNAALRLGLVNTSCPILSASDLSLSLLCQGTCHVPDPLSWHSPLNEFVDINDQLEVKPLSLQQTLSHFLVPSLSRCHYEKLVDLSLPGTDPMPGRCPGEKSGSNPSRMTRLRLAVWINWRSVAYPFSTPLQLSWWHWGQLLQRFGALLFAHSEQMPVPFRASLTQRDQLSLQQLLASVPVRTEGGVWTDEEMWRDLRREGRYSVLYFLSCLTLKGLDVKTGLCNHWTWLVHQPSYLSPVIFGDPRWI